MHATPPASPRLGYRRLTPTDAPFLLALLNSRGWLDNIGDRGVHDVADAERYIEAKIHPACTSPAFGPYLARELATGTAVGTVGVYARPTLEVPDLGFALLPEFQGRGLGREAAGVILDFAAEQGLNELSAISLPQNTPSARVLTSLGFRQNGTVRLTEDDPELLYWTCGK